MTLGQRFAHTSEDPPESIDCAHCGAQVSNRSLARGEILRCSRCRSTVKRYRPQGAERAACALALSGLVLLLWANLYPIMIFSVTQMTQSNEIITGIQVLFLRGYWPIAGLVLFCAIVAPALYFLGVAYSAGACLGRHQWPGAVGAAVLAQVMQPWSLLPVFALACLVAAVKLDLIGHVAWQPGVWLIGLLALVALCIDSLFDGEQILRQLRSSTPPSSAQNSA
jgi:paraquat-inducible protein A